MNSGQPEGGEGEGERGAASPLQDEIAHLVQLLASARDNDLRLPDALPASHPLHALSESVHEVIAMLAEERDRRGRLQAELEERLTTIELQRAALRDLSTPIIEVWSGTLCVPIMGVVDVERSAQMMDHLLAAVSSKAATYVILDITGVDHMDNRMLDYFVSMAKAIQLLGASCVITGIRPSVAQMLAAMDVDMSAIKTLRSLGEALARVVKRPRRA